MKKPSTICLLTLILSFLVNPAAATDWYEMESGTASPLYGAWGSSATDVFAVGGSGTILHYDGSSWSAMSSGTTNHLNEVWGSSATDVFAVGTFGTILHYDGSSWSAMGSGTTNHLNEVWGSSATDVFAVGGSGTILHYDGSSWSAMSSGTTSSLSGIWGSSATDVFAVSSIRILHYDGSSWSVMISGTSTLYDIWGSSATDVFAVGYNETILHYDGSSWTSMDDGMTMPWYYLTVGGSSSTNVFVGSEIIIRYNGSSWSFMRYLDGQVIYSIWGSSDTNVFAVGSNGIILRYIDDFDNDGILNESDNCPYHFNPAQADADSDSVGDICDNCLTTPNPDQADFNVDGVGDACEDSDNDTINDDLDNCPSLYNLEQTDKDADGFGDVCDRGDRFAVVDNSQDKVFIFDMWGTLLHTTDWGTRGSPWYIRDSGSNGWLVKGPGTNNDMTIWHIDSSGALRNTFSDDSIGHGQYYSGINNGNVVVNDSETGNIYLYNTSGTLINSTNAWSDPNGWSYDYDVMGDIAGLVGGGFVVLPEFGAYYFEGAGFTPYLYFYDNNLNLINKVNITALHITLFPMVGLSNGGFVGIGNTNGGDYLSHLFYFDSSGNLESSRDISADIPSYPFLSFSISATNDGGVIIAEVFGSNVWIYHSPPVQLDLSGAGVSSIGGIGGSYFQTNAYKCYADCNCDTEVNLADLVIMKQEFLRTDCAVNQCAADCNDDNRVDLSDLVMMKGEFLRSDCPVCP